MVLLGDGRVAFLPKSLTVFKATGILAAMTESQSKHREFDDQRLDALNQIAGELKLIRETLDQIRTDVQWWTQNPSQKEPECT